jgi:hypothetical protein
MSKKIKVLSKIKKILKNKKKKMWTTKIQRKPRMIRKKIKKKIAKRRLKKMM